VSDLTDAIRANRKRVLDRDTATLATIQTAYTRALERLEPLIELAIDQIREFMDSDEWDTLTDAEKARAAFRLDRYRELERQMVQQLDRLGADTSAIVRSEQRWMARTGQDAALDLIRASDPTLTASFANVPSGAIEDLIAGFTDGPLARLTESAGLNAAAVLREQLTTALAMGTNPRAVAKSISAAMDMSRVRALNIARTEMLRALRSSTLATYRANEDILSGWRWIAAHSRRTCAACLAMDGQEFPLTVEHFPAHPACRCTAIPVLKRGRKEEIETGAEWLERQSADVQDEVLGKSGGALYRSGDVALDDFVRVRESDVWGDTTSNGGVGWALGQAERRTRRRAA
jgi:SPP1 gp7 family putative phage head morphogenesis protein